MNQAAAIAVDVDNLAFTLALGLADTVLGVVKPEDIARELELAPAATVLGDAVFDLVNFVYASTKGQVPDAMLTMLVAAVVEKILAMAKDRGMVVTLEELLPAVGTRVERLLAVARDGGRAAA